MTIYDAAMAIVVVLGMVRGAWRGFTWQMASIASLIVGYIAAHSGSAQVAAYLPGEPEVQRMLAMAVIYVAVSGGIFGLAWMVRGTLRKLKLEAYDRHLGMLLGGLEGVGVGMLVTLFLVSVAPGTRQPIFSSPTGHVVGTVMDKLGPVLPAEVRKVLAPHWDGDPQAPESVADQDEKGQEHPVWSSHGPAAADVATAALPAPHEAVESGDPSHHADDLPALPALESSPSSDPAVHKAGGAHGSGDLPALEAPQGDPGGTAATLHGIIQQGRHDVEQAVAGALDVDSGPKATSLRQLAGKDRQHIKGAVQNLGKSKQKVASQVKDRVSQGAEQVEQAINDSIISKVRQRAEQAINDSIDQQLERLGGLESAPQKGGK